MNTVKLQSNFLKEKHDFTKILKDIVDNIVKTSDTDIILDPNFIAIDYFSRFQKYNKIYSKLLQTYTYNEMFYLFSELFYKSTNNLIEDIIKDSNEDSRDYINASFLKTLRKQSPDRTTMIEIDSYISYKSNYVK